MKKGKKIEGLNAGIGYWPKIKGDEPLVENQQFSDLDDMGADLAVFQGIDDIRLVSEDEIASLTGLDRGIASLVVALSDIAGIRTFTSCSAIHSHPKENYPIVGFWAKTNKALDTVQAAAQKAKVKISWCQIGFLAYVPQKKDVARMRDMAIALLDAERGKSAREAIRFSPPKGEIEATEKADREENRQAKIDNDAYNERLFAIQKGDAISLYRHAVAHAELMKQCGHKLLPSTILEQWMNEDRQMFDRELCLKARQYAYAKEKKNA